MTHGPLAFGVTLDQIDQLDRLLRTIIANGDMVTVGCKEPLHPHTVSALGEGIFDAALTVREVLDQVNEQRLRGKRHPGLSPKAALRPRERSENAQKGDGGN